MLVAKFVVKALNTALFPGGAGLDVDRANLLPLQPVFESVGDKFGPVITANVFRRSVFFDRLTHMGDELARGHGPTSLEKQTRAGVFINEA